MAEPAPFELFGRAHLTTIAITLAVAVAVPLAARRLPERAERLLAWAIIIALPVYRTAWTVHRVLDHGDPWRSVIPLGICPLLFYLCPWMLWRRGQGVYEVAYYWAIGGTPKEDFDAEQAGGPPVASHHSPLFKITPEPSIRTGVESTVVALLDLMAE